MQVNIITNQLLIIILNNAGTWTIIGDSCQGKMHSVTMHGKSQFQRPPGGTAGHGAVSPHVFRMEEDGEQPCVARSVGKLSFECTIGAVKDLRPTVVSTYYLCCITRPFFNNIVGKTHQIEVRLYHVVFQTTSTCMAVSSRPKTSIHCT